MLHLPPNQTNSPNVFFERSSAYEVFIWDSLHTVKQGKYWSYWVPKFKEMENPALFKGFLVEAFVPI